MRSDLTSANQDLFAGRRLRVRIIFNPISGRRRRDGYFPEFIGRLETAGHDVTLCETTAAGDATRLAKESCEAGVDLICVRGGDGTIHEAAAGMLEGGPPILTIPAGTENILSKYLGIRGRASSLMSAIGGGQFQQMRLSSVNGRKFMLMMGLPFDAEVVRRLEAKRKGNISYKTYVWPILSALFKYRAPVFRVTLDGEECYGGRGQVFVGKMPRYALGMKVLKDAVTADSLLDVVIFPRSSFWPLLWDGVRIWIRPEWRSKNAIYRKGTVVRIEAETPAPFEVDGEFGGYSPAEIVVTDQVVKFLTAPGRFGDFPSIWLSPSKSDSPTPTPVVSQ